MPSPVAAWVDVPLEADREADRQMLRCWWSPPAAGAPRAGVLVLPEVFGVNRWVRSVADRLADRGYAALAVPLFQHTAPGLELGYGTEDLQLGRLHKDRTTAARLLADLGCAVTWLGRQTGEGPLGCVGFCFGGHVAMLAASLASVRATCSFYGAGVASGRPGGGPPTLAVVPSIPGHLLCVFGRSDPLIPPADVEAVRQALAAGGLRHRLRLLDAGHGFLCEDRPDYNAAAAAEGWREMLDWFEQHLGSAGP